MHVTDATALHRVIFADGFGPQSQLLLQKKTEDLKSMGKTPNVILPDRLRFTYVTCVGLRTQLGMHNCKPMVCGLAYF